METIKKLTPIAEMMMNKLNNILFAIGCIGFSLMAFFKYVIKDYIRDHNPIQLVAGIVTIILFNAGFYILHKTRR